MQTIEGFLNRINPKYEEICWISPVSTQIQVLYNGESTYLIRAIFGYFNKEYNGKVERSCGNKMCINPYHLSSPTPEERFWSNVFIGDDDECWEWKSLSGTDRYAMTSYNGEDIGAHRLAYKLSKGNLRDLCVCHTCDNPPCCNPNHLFLGTHQDNIDDREAKGRNKLPHSRGEEHGQNKLTKEEVLEIRDYYKSGEWSYRALASLYGVSFGNIRKIIKRETWNWI